MGHLLASHLPWHPFLSSRIRQVYDQLSMAESYLCGWFVVDFVAWFLPIFSLVEMASTGSDDEEDNDQSAVTRRRVQLVKLLRLVQLLRLYRVGNLRVPLR